MDDIKGKILRIGITCAAVISTLYGCVVFGKGIADAQKNLDVNPNYRIEQVYKKADENLSDASYCLTYRGPFNTFIPVKVGKTMTFIPVYHPARYPKPDSAVSDIENALANYHQTPEGSTDSLDLDSVLEEVISELPDSDWLTSYKGKHVNNSTFREQREEIGKTRESIKEEIRLYDSRVPDELKNAKTDSIIKFALTLIGGSGAAILPHLIKKEEDSYDRYWY